MQAFFKHTVLCAAIAGCATVDAPSIEQADQPVTCPVPTIIPARSLEVTDQAVLDKFSFERVMTQIATSGHATNTINQIWHDWMATYANCSDPKIDPNGYGITCPRVENTLQNIDPFETSGARFVPTALANRFDLAPRSGADCGEYRIVYAMLNGNGRAFLIFEGRLPNPTPSAGLAGCAPVADFWAQLSTDPSATSRASKLEQFYFTGLTGFAPVVDAANYGLSAITGTPAVRRGQIRTNMFVQGRQWNLREFQLTKPCAVTASCALAVEHVTVKVNPANELFSGMNSNAPAFQAAFLNQIPALSRGKAANISMTNADRFNEFESVSQNATDVVYRNFATASFKAQITAQLTGSTLNVTNILDRATTQTCAGCHQISTAAPLNQLGDGVVWPLSGIGGFVHVDEQSRLSPALTDVFLPQRSSVLTSFLRGQCNGTAITDDGTNLGGGAIDAAN